MPRYERQEIPQGQQNWQDPANENFENIFDKPFPPASYSLPGSLPNPAEFEDTIAVAAGELYVSDGVSWTVLSAVTGGLTELATLDLTGLNIGSISYDSAWDSYRNIHLLIRGVGVDVVCKVGFTAKHIDLSTFVPMRQAGISTGKFIAQDDNDIYGGAVDKLNNFSIKFRNDLSVTKGVSLVEAGCFDSGGSTKAINVRGNVELLNSSWSSATGNNDHGVIMDTNDGSVATAFTAFEVHLEAGSLFDSGTFSILGE